MRLSGGTQPDSILDHVKIEYGKDPGLLINANSNSLSFTVTNTAVKESLGNGMSIRGIGTVNNCVIQHNSNAGLKILGGAPGIQNTSFLNNEAVAVSAPSMLETRNFGTGNTYTGNVPDAIEWTNTSLTEVKISMTLNNQGVPYIANGSIDVGEFPNPITFTIHPGVEIRFNPQQNLRLGVGTTYASHFIAQGTAQDPIIFTSNAAQPQKGDWQGVRFSGTTTNLTLDHVVIEYGQDPNFEMYQPVNFSITNSIFRYALGRGIVLRGNGTFNNNVVEENDGQGLHIAHGAPSILNSFIQNNVLTGLWVDALATTPAFDGNQFLNNGSRAANIYSINQLRYMTANNTFFGITNPICECIELMNTAESLIDYDTTLFNFGYPYVLNGDLSIYKDNSRAILTVTPGVTLQFKPGLNLQLKVGGFNANAKGALLAYGTSTDPITFSSSNPIPAPGDWQGIRLETGAQPETAFRHTIIEYAGNPGLRVNQSFARVENTIFQFQTGDHIQLTGSNSYLFIQQSQFSANGFNAVNNTGPNMVQAPLNWWGHETGPSGSGGGSGIPIQGNVHYDPWLGTPRTAPFQWQSAHISPREFKPADNTATFQLSPTDGINWTIEILSSDFSQVLKTITGSGAMIQQDWEGDDQNNETLPDDDYKFRVSGTRISNGEPIASAIGQLTLNQNIPVAKITLPVADDFLAGFTAYDITGTASGADFQDFTLEYYNTNTGIGFNTLASGQNPIEEGLIFNWDLADLAASFITLRLTVTDTAQRVAVDEVPVRIFNLFNISNSESFISPNNDQIQDASLIEAQSTHLADWLLEIKDDAHATVRSIDRDGFVFFSFLWDGKNDAGNLVPDGEYTYEFTVTESSTNVSPPTQPGATAVTVDTVYPETVITDPVNNQSIFGLSYGVIGTANDLNFKDYVLEHSRDGFPNQFDVFATGNANVVNDLLGTWPDLHTFSNGNYAIRLNTADKAGNRVIILVPVVLDNINITDISRAPVFFDHKRGETGNINYTISLDADVTIRLIEDRDGGVLIRTLLDQEPRLAGVHQEVWDGRDDQGSLLPYEAYYFEIEAETTEGRHDLFIDPRQDTWNYSPGMVEFIGENFDPYKSEKVIFTYHPTYHIRHFINILDGNLQGIRTIQMDEPKPKDETSAVRWDGRKYDGSFHTGFYKLNIEIPIDPDLHEQTIILKDTFEHPASVYQANAYLILPLNGEVTHFQYTLDNQADITVTIEDPNGSHFRTLVDNEPQSQGNYEVLWDGKNDLGEYAAIEGHYRFTINAVDQVTGSEKAVIGNVSVYQS
ncbi:MAG: hypothetical protein COV74_06685 [Candidatus Omnitrophica bacterium CG11_big_fil_rev_8_21_14_0_20_45_26]|uniref:FlgD/Vpr Ig-like domain-containing protein n=1 Tax=Candidatus Abzuiibacterium crystallinum TaxID=1974748 RepID=A0A2H0LNK0_9BACT|nr:MAG: hypothetical protein COV74_06685 [Candidatus Omnitrophica bacterium CG11_big_fil_rev_8_21_14_0_20_45_26]